jgi:hypothetical protein
MKTICLIIAAVLFATSGCKKEDNPVQPVHNMSMEDQINAARPYKVINIYWNMNTNLFTYLNDTTVRSDYTDAYAKSGFFIIKTRDNGDVYYSINNAIAIDIIKDADPLGSEITFRY